LQGVCLSATYTISSRLAFVKKLVYELQKSSSAKGLRPFQIV